MSGGGWERLRSWLPGTAAVGVGVLAVVGVVTAGPLAPLPAVFAVSAVVVLIVFPERTRPWTAALAGLAALVSAGVTPVLLVGGGVTVPIAVWGVGEAGALLVLTVLVCRRAATLGRAAVAMAVLGPAEAGLMVRVVWPESLSNMLLTTAYWSLGAAVAVAVGLHLRSMDEAWARSVAAARRTQRLELARDLHDFVAHDVTGMVVQAQAATHVLAGQPEVGAALKRIEEAGQRALASMDRTVHMLRGTDDEPAVGPAPPRVPTLADLPALVGHFAAIGPSVPRLRVDHRAAAAADRETATTAYRVVTEALTNIRRHAPTAAHVEISIGCDDGPGDPDDPGDLGGLGGPKLTGDGGSGSCLVVVVSNGLTPAGRQGAAPAYSVGGAHRRHGLGLISLAERVEALCGTLTAGPTAPGTWQVTAVLPMSALARTPARATLSTTPEEPWPPRTR
ncbi:sensor histidine kinase [Streptomyces phaeochromogenes]|uniref:sensor histidine kinase n=1 Tax=Streptomyces phaeochromogenes TaxID=1923 RepID=UPI002DDA4369|nr:histidine kinase [Streptomyces phaeochromogenes]WRZ31944.1 histidine kinase [Streptomyces phaeochromogenes]